MLNRDEIIDRTGAENWDMVVTWFTNLSAEEVLESCNDIWPTEDNQELAESIVHELNSYSFEVE